MQIKRNETIFETLADAKNGLKVPAGTVSDGDIIVSRYATGSVLGVVRVDQQTDVQTWTIYDTDSRILYVDPQGTVLYTLYEYLYKADQGANIILLNNFVPSYSSKIEVKFRETTSVTAPRVIGSGGEGNYNNKNSFALGIYQNKPFIKAHGDTTFRLGSSTIASNTDHIFVSNNGVLTVDGNIIVNGQGIGSGTSITGLAAFSYYTNYNGTVDIGTSVDSLVGRIYYIKVYDSNDNVIHEYVPAVRYDNASGFYDKNDEKFYTQYNSTYPIVCGGEEIGKIYGSSGLPDVEFEINYNAKLYNSTTHTIPNHEDAHTQVDMVFQSGYYPTYTEGSDHITWPTLQNGPALGSNVNPNFNRTSSAPNLTIIAKALTTTSGAQALFVNRGTNYNWMFRWYKTRLTLHGTSETGQIAVSDSEPNIAWARVNSSAQVDYGNYTQETTVQPVAFTYGSQNNLGPAFFRGYSNQNAEIWGGDFYWLYMTKQTLTDDQIKQVIEYNETL